MLIKLQEFYKKGQNLSLPHRGIVVSNEDPLKLKRVKVVIESLLDGLTMDQLPWMAPWNGNVGQGGSPGATDGDVPAEGTELVIEFKFNDVYCGFYTGYWTSSDCAPGAFNEDYPYTYGKQDEAGNLHTQNKLTGETLIQHQSGLQTRTDSEGNTTITASALHRTESDDGQSFVQIDPELGLLNLGGRDGTHLQGAKTVIETDTVEVKTGGLQATYTGSVVETISGQRRLKAGGESSAISGNSQKSVAGFTNNLYAFLAKETFGTGYEADVVTGAYLINVLLGAFNVQAAASSLNVSAAGVNAAAPLFNVAAAAKAGIVAPLINLGLGLAPIVTILTDPIEDYITGKPKIGVPTITAG